MFYALAPFLSPVLLGLLAIAAFRSQGPTVRSLQKISEGVALLAFLGALVSVALLAGYGGATSPLIGAFGFGFSARLDAVTGIALTLVGFVGWIVLRFSATYMDGEPKQRQFIGWMAITLASVMVFVISGNVMQLFAGWVAISLGLHKLLLFYEDRKTAQRAARKKALTARASEGFLAIALMALSFHHGTTDIAAILGAAQPGALSVLAAASLAIAAILASAQFPFHGWLTEVMEAPTPVSALLHAGVINAGGFILIRFADVLLAAPGVMALLVMLGGFTALFGGLVMLTQPAVKTSLAWSTVAQMGFMLLQCGLALFPLALLHIVAHSLYKAHAFLSAGGAIAHVEATRRPGPIAVPSAANVLRAFVVAIGIYASIGLVFGLDGKSVQAIALGVILIFGVAYLLAQGFADAAPMALTLRTTALAGAASVSYFTLQIIANYLTSSTLPAVPAPGALEWALILLALVSFGAVAVAQATFPLWATHPAALGIRVHLANGLYVNAIFDRALNRQTLGKAG